MMQLIRLEAAIVFGIVFPQVSSMRISSASSDCLAAVETCMSDLCEIQQAVYSGICKDEGCQIKGSEVCNMTIQTVLDQFPSLPGCVCAWEEELCDSIDVLAAQCLQKPAVPQRSAVMDWKTSALKDLVNDAAGSCLDRTRVCVSDTVCNRHLVPVLQECTTKCHSERCLQATRRFYSRMPQNVAEMLAMCECEASDQTCLHMRNVLHGGTCGEEPWICQQALHQCVEDDNCRNLLEMFQAKCWSPEEAACSDSMLRSEECFTRMDPALVLGGDSECKKAFLDTLGTVLHHPCVCKGMNSQDLATCERIHDVLHDRSLFTTNLTNHAGPSKSPGKNKSKPDSTQVHDYLLYAVAAVLLVGVTVVMPLAAVIKVWTLRRDTTKFHHPVKSQCVAIA
ncbi:GDNF family receptor alpha-like [Salarias fasciatus]|uniref:GDNF family receptor alpha-like n=1 Tax=Salarias fasciatus TaxID=181472 RepID=UPI00117666BD|nr:GDNF family receptor alpha-like [Salarias fasciatus]